MEVKDTHLTIYGPSRGHIEIFRFRCSSFVKEDNKHAITYLDKSMTYALRHPKECFSKIMQIKS